MTAGHTAEMSTRQAVGAWLTSFTIAAGIALALCWHAPTLEDRVFEGVDTPVIVIGSSLMLFGVSPSADRQAASLLGDGRAHTRIAVMALLEHESLGLVRRAIESGTETILLEANTFIVDIQHVHQATQQAPWERFKHRVSQFVRSVHAGARAFIGLAPVFDIRTIPEIDGLDNEFFLDPAKLERDYPLVLHPPRYPAEMRAITQEALQAGIEVILVAPPRPQAAADILGPETTGALEEQITTLATELDLPLFRPATVWPNRFFIDHGHLNSRGRRRFMSELAAWAAQRK